VIEYTISRTTRRMPRGSHDRAKICTQSTMNRIQSSPMKVHRTPSMI
jgi:hypothetical protein